MWSSKTRHLLLKALRRLLAASTVSLRRLNRAPLWTHVRSATVVFGVIVFFNLSTSYAQQSLTQDRSSSNDNGAKTRNASPAQFRSIDEATTYIQGQHPGAKIVKVVQRQRDDGSKVAKFRILTADGRMKNISLTFD